MVVTLYHFPISPPSRAALLVARAVGVAVDVKIVNLIEKEQFKPDYVKINPQHTVPTLVDGDFILWESRAIAAYLVRTYGKDDSLYPTDVKKRALVDQRLQFDCGTLYPAIRAIIYPIFYQGVDEIYDEHRAKLEEVLGFLDVFLEGNNFVCGNTVTIADCALVSSLSGIIAAGWNISAYSNVQSWVARCALEMSGYDSANQAGSDEYGKLVRKFLLPGQL